MVSQSTEAGASKKTGKLGMLGFTIVWAGQMLSLLGTNMTGFALAIWQSKVAPDVQGRVFATRLLIAQISAPVAMLMAGPVADRLFEPGMMSSGGLARFFGWLIGTGPGAGMALMFLITGIAGAFVGLGAYAFRAVRDAEDVLPDHDARASVEGQALSDSN